MKQEFWSNAEAAFSQKNQARRIQKVMPTDSMPRSVSWKWSVTFKKSLDKWDLLK